MAFIHCINASIGYQGKKVVENLNFSVNSGDYLCVVGENGSGKSTLMKTILGLIQPIDGEMKFSDGLNRKEIGYLPQQTEVQRDFPASVWEIVLSGCLNRCGSRPFYNKGEKQMAKEHMRTLGIDGLAKKYYSELSGGQQQRVLLARALCATQKIILLDEPVSGLDPKAAEDMYKVIEELNKNHNITVIMISHDIVSAVQYASHILHIEKEPLFFGTKQDYIETDFKNTFTIADRGRA